MEKELQIVEDLSTFLNEMIFSEDELIWEVSENSVQVENKSESSLSNIYKNMPLDSLDIFELGVEFVLVSASEDGGFGLILGANGQSTAGSLNNYLRLLIEPTGQFRIDHFVDGENEFITDGHSEFINQGNASNQITVRKNGSAVYFLVNGELLFMMHEVELAGTQFGFILGPLTTVSITSFYFASPETIESVTKGAQRPHDEIEDGHEISQNSSDYHQGYRPARKRSKFKVFLIVILLLTWAAGFLVYHEAGYIHLLFVTAILLMIIRRKKERETVMLDN